MDERRIKAFKKVTQIVRRHGWYGMYVPDHEPPYMYTIGLMQSYDHPELIVFGHELDCSHALLSAVIRKIRKGQSFAGPSVAPVKLERGGDRFAFRRVHPSQHPVYLGFAGDCREYMGLTRLKALQVFWHDEAGKFPFDVGCDKELFEHQLRLDRPLSASQIRQFEEQVLGAN
jgi:Domain of unknown function (DUF4262)